MENILLCSFEWKVHIHVVKGMSVEINSLHFTQICHIHCICMTATISASLNVGLRQSVQPSTGNNILIYRRWWKANLV